jgi:hypothetical protein
VDHRLDDRDFWMLAEQGQARPDHRHAADLAVLLGHVAAGAQPTSSGNNYSGDGSGHGELLQETWQLPLAWTDGPAKPDLGLTPRGA